MNFETLPRLGLMKNGSASIVEVLIEAAVYSLLI